MNINQRPSLAAVPAYRQGKSAAPGASKLSSNESPHAPLPSVVQSIAEGLESIHRYPNMAAPELITALADQYDLDPEEISLGAGSVEVASQLIHAVAGEDDEVMFAWRSFEAYPSLVRIAGAVPVEIPLDAEFKHDLPAMLDAITERTRLIFICNPNNPTGTVVAADALEEFVAAVPRNILVVIDEAYVHFDRSDIRADGLKLFRKYPHVAVLHTFSKAYGLAGLRIGYAVSPKPVAQNLRKVAVPFGVTDLAQRAAVASLEAAGELGVRINEVVEQRERMLEGLLAAGYPAVPSEANFVWVAAAERTAELEALLSEGNVVVRAFPGEGLRISSGSAQDVDRVLAAVTSKVEVASA
ncbi:histidinol-phosphate transaminase [Arthrobacter sp. MYb211]|uniref:histidinol-phosphate transaminase n=1 Tax=Micrococcaceae TaxID=1268 RepID=UPI000CFB53C0|nr:MULTISPECIES: histidinol-phosphate transaminase [unclassified Arthrobacter]PRA01238.1 histidinol-phosphate transaminase [Arthrobacter sp. MYb224]PRA13738.1 histidinol-phosphate transaminase [Arthrobacter sp. MYb221]PRC09107.1 histidinol-phosphate transaminase [Arthrobacter sp. MYb211]